MELSEVMPETVEKFLDDLNRGPDFGPNDPRLHLLGVMKNCVRDGTEFVDDDALEEALADYYEFDERLGTVYSILSNSGFSVSYIGDIYDDTDYSNLCLNCGLGKAKQNYRP